MFSQCLIAIGFLGLICIANSLQAQQGKHSAESRLPNTQVYSGIDSHSGDRMDGEAKNVWRSVCRRSVCLAPMAQCMPGTYRSLSFILGAH